MAAQVDEKDGLDWDKVHALMLSQKHGSTTDAVTHALREAILSELLVPGVWLREDRIARALGVSRTPVREALRRLAGENLTTQESNRGAMIVPLTLEEVLALYEVRASLEGLATRHAARRSTPEHVRRLRNLQVEMRAVANRPAELTALNLRFHRMIRSVSPSFYLDRFLTQTEQTVQRFGGTTFESPSRVQVALDEHDQIIDAIEVKDAALGEKLASAHMRNAREIRIQQMLDT